MWNNLSRKYIKLWNEQNKKKKLSVKQIEASAHIVPISHPMAEEGVRAFMGKGEEADASWIKEEFTGAW